MTLEFDEKGKIFTPVVSKSDLPARIRTATNLVEGRLHIRRDNRLKDELDAPEPFLAVTDATICEPDGRPLFRSDFIAIRRDQVVWVAALADIHQAGAA
ncbi:MAG: hypothetical protein FJZ96_00970 [Chloroflexi bacterium]|nr:hypothetical protein [Chloroflexota bacterium]